MKGTFCFLWIDFIVKKYGNVIFSTRQCYFAINGQGSFVSSGDPKVKKEEMIIMYTLLMYINIKRRQFPLDSA